MTPNLRLRVSPYPPPEQIKEQDERGIEQIQHNCQWKQAQDLSKSNQKRQHKRQGAAERQRKHQHNVALAEASQGLRNPVTLHRIKVMKLVCEKLPTTNAENSKKRRASPTNYFGPTQFAMIERAAALCEFSHPELIVKELKLGPNGTLFQALQRGTVFHWIKDNHSGWTNKVMDCVAHAAESKKKVKPLHVASKGSKLGWPAQLDKYPQVLKNIVQLLSNIQCAGCLITCSVTQGVTLGFILADAPKLFHDPLSWTWSHDQYKWLHAGPSPNLGGSRCNHGLSAEE
ncbi:hypothetical protein RHS04_08363 [Rhizoctonia solani]|uniref:Uncharacterized protein n=1 Tax=Rhizoctonia solani TaxID=456999 RepID=A0A8H7LGN1_9AGAM|nr:hypothetical protein RHS04_08363 [Rhizoctonia solani]